MCTLQNELLLKIIYLRQLAELSKSCLILHAS